MNPAQVLDHFDRICDAPDAIPRLRRFILDLAVRGKLVEQDPNDEPASELLKRIQAEKAEKAKKQKTRIGNELDDFSFVLPSGWELVPLSNLCVLENGDRSRNYLSRDRFVKEGIPFINAGHLQFGGICLNSMNFISEETFNLLKSGKVRNGDILFCLRGSLGKAALVGGISRGAIASSLVIIRLMTGVSPRFVLNYLSTSLATDMIGRFDNGTAQPNLSSEDLGKFVFPLPPIAEQQRIVAKVDQLMALCDCLEVSQAERESRRNKLVASFLHRLNSGADADEFREHARFHLPHLPSLTTRPEHIQQLRQTILNLAVRGKLVPQDPRDEPTSELVKNIEAEKVKAMRAGEIKKLEAYEPVEKNEVPFNIPSGWELIRMGSLARKLGAGSTPLGGRSVYQNKGVPFLRSQNVYNDGLRLDDVAFISRAIHERMSGTHIQQQDILLNITGASIGRCALVPSTFVEGNVSQHVAIIRLFLPAIREFIHLSLTSPFFQKVIDDVQVGVSREGLSMKTLRLFPMLLPPFAEQHRIVAKVHELMTLCDRLEAQLTENQTESRLLLEAVLHEALSGHA